VASFGCGVRVVPRLTWRTLATRHDVTMSCR
jgi:hypothetical protein